VAASAENALNNTTWNKGSYYTINLKRSYPMAPTSEGRSGSPGNSTEYHPIGISTPRPELLQPGKVKANKSSREVLGGGSSGWPGKKNYETRKGGKGKSAY
jgi:hypothetical protein